MAQILKALSKFALRDRVLVPQHPYGFINVLVPVVFDVYGLELVAFWVHPEIQASPSRARGLSLGSRHFLALNSSSVRASRSSSVVFGSD